MMYTDSLKSASFLCIHVWCTALLFLNVFFVDTHSAGNILLLVLLLLLLYIYFMSWTTKIKSIVFDVIYTQREVLCTLNKCDGQTVYLGIQEMGIGVILSF